MLAIANFQESNPVSARALAAQPKPNIMVRTEKATAAPIEKKLISDKQKEEKIPKQKRKIKDGLHLHPKGDEKKPIKVSCAPCIAGHRSGDCSHYDRILLKIRAAGRPSQACHHQSRCGSKCLQSQAFIVCNETPEWCTEGHCRCIVNWDHSPETPDYPLPSSSKRKQRESTPAESVEQRTSSISSNEPPASATSKAPSEPSSGKACSSHRETKHAPVNMHQSMPAPGPLFAASYTPPILSTHPRCPPPSADMTSTHTVQEPVGFMGYPSEFQQMLDSGAYDMQNSVAFGVVGDLNPGGFAYCTSTGASDYSRLPATSSGHRQSLQRDRSPPAKRQCPGSGFNCPCEPDQCICSKCFTHNQGLELGTFRPANTPEPQRREMPPREITPEQAQNPTFYEYRNPGMPYSDPAFNMLETPVEDVQTGTFQTFDDPGQDPSTTGLGYYDPYLFMPSMPSLQ